MDHIAIMKKEWGLIPKILDGQKMTESRWYKNKICPWGKINVDDAIYFKDSGYPVTVVVKVTRIEQFEVHSNDEGLQIMYERALQDLGTKEIPQSVVDYISNKHHAIFVYFDSPKRVEPFDIDKSGYGSQCAWIAVDDVNRVKKA